MTIRESLGQKRRRAAIAAFGGFAVFAASLVLSDLRTGPSPVVWLGLVLLGSAILYQLFAIRCPRCAGNLGKPLSYVGGPFKVSPKVRFCLYCGVELDAPVDGTRNPPLQPTRAAQPNGRDAAGSGPRG